MHGDHETKTRRAWFIEALGSLHDRRVVHHRDISERPLLDSIRWVAAMLVLLGHSIGLIFGRQGLGGSHLRPLDFISDLRGPSVTLFFVISGYLVGGGVLGRAERFDVRRYIIARFSRIYIVLIPAILLILVLDGAAHLIDPNNAVYASVWPTRVLGSAPINARYEPINWIVTLFSLESVVAPPAGSGNALWSLGYEWVFYFVFPLLVLPMARFRSLFAPLVPIALVLIALVIVHRRFDAAFFLIWVAGAYARMMVDHAVTPRWFSALGLAIMLLCLTVSQFVYPGTTSLGIGIGFAMYLCRFNPAERGISRRLDRSLADISYSLYVTHLPVIVFLTMLANRAGVLAISGRSIDAIGLTLLAIYLCAGIAVAMLFGRLFERRTDDLRLWLSAKW